MLPQEGQQEGEVGVPRLHVLSHQEPQQELDVPPELLLPGKQPASEQRHGPRRAVGVREGGGVGQEGREALLQLLPPAVAAEAPLGERLTQLLLRQIGDRGCLCLQAAAGGGGGGDMLEASPGGLPYQTLQIGNIGMG